jgi:hypothetical protein
LIEFDASCDWLVDWDGLSLLQVEHPDAVWL